MFVSAIDAGKELLDRFNNFAVNGQTIGNAPYFDAYRRISSALTAVSGVQSAMVKLNAKMVDLLVERLKKGGHGNASPEEVEKAAAAYYRQRAEGFKAMYGPNPTQIKTPPEEAKYPQREEIYHGLLDEALWVEEKSAGFQRATDYMWNGITANTFLANLRDKRPFKDLGARPEHGEFTHRLQWYVVSKTVYNSTPSAEVFASLADWYDPTAYKSPALWDALFDRAPNTSFEFMSANDYRSPNNFFRWIRLESAGTPVLSAFLESRYNKRSGHGEAGQELANMQNNTALKLFRQPYNNLTSAQRLEVMGKLQSGIVPHIKGKQRSGQDSE
jgi:hypothetical protein